MYVSPLREMDPTIIPRDRLEQFIREVFHNFGELHAHHRKMLTSFHEIQREEHPVIRTVTAAVYDAVLNFREAYLEYIPNYPIAAYRIDDEMANNPSFQTFVEVHDHAHGFHRSCWLIFFAAMYSPLRCAQAGHEGFHQPSYPKIASV